MLDRATFLEKIYHRCAGFPQQAPSSREDTFEKHLL